MSKPEEIPRAKLEKIVERYLKGMTSPNPPLGNYKMDCPVCDRIQCLERKGQDWICGWDGCSGFHGIDFPKDLDPPAPAEIFQMAEEARQVRRRQSIEALFKKFNINL